MEINIPTPKPERVVVYEFEFEFGKKIQIDVWPDQGDTITMGGETLLTFNFPRIKFTQTIYLPHVITHSVEEKERLYVDQKELNKKLLDEHQKRLHEQKTHTKETLK